MKIAIISPNPHHLQEMREPLQVAGHQIRTFEGGKSRMRDIAEQEAPDLLLVDGICRDPAELEQIEHVTAQHPATVVVLLCASHSPEFLIGAMRAGVREVLASPPRADDLLQAVARVSGKLRGSSPPQGRLVAFMGCKGGSGTTFLATTLGWHLAERANVLLIDLNLQFGDALSFMHDGKPATSIADLARDLARLDASLLGASAVKLTPSYSVLPAPDDLSQSLEVRTEHLSAILDVALAHYDFVLVDLPRSLDALAITAMDRAMRVFVVLQSTVPDLRHASRLMRAFRSLGYAADRTEAILNRFDRSSEIGLEQVRRTLGDIRLTTVPNAWREVSASVNQGEPLARRARSGPVARQLAELARSINPRQEDDRSLLNRLFRRA